MNTARSGSVRENKLRHYLERQGWSCIRAAGSKGVFDLVAIRSRPELYTSLIQVKTNHWPCGGELKELIRFAKAAAITPGNQTQIVVVKFITRSSLALWVDMIDVVSQKKPYDWRCVARQVDLRE